MPGLLQSHQIVFSTSLLSAFILLALLLSEGSLKYANLTSSAALLKPFNDVTAFRVKTKIFSKVVYKALCTLKGVSVLYSYHYSVLSLIFLLQSLDFFLDSPMCLAPFTLKAFVKKSPFARNTSSPHCLLNYSSFVPVRGITSQGSFTKLKPYVRARARVCVCVSFSHVWLFVTSRTVACQAPLSKEFSRQEYWSGLSFPSPGDLPDLGTELWSLALQALFTTEPPGKPLNTTCMKDILVSCSQSTCIFSS